MAVRVYGQATKMNEGEPIRRRKLSHEILDRLLARVTRGELAPASTCRPSAI